MDENEAGEIAYIISNSTNEYLDNYVLELAIKNGNFEHVIAFDNYFEI